MGNLTSYQDFQRTGFSPYLRSSGGMGEVRRFIRTQLDQSLKDPDAYFPFAAFLAGYARGKYHEDVPRDLRGEVRRQAIDAFWMMLPDFKRMVFASRRKETRLAMLRGLFLGLPTVVLEQSETTTARRVLQMVDVWLLAHVLLRTHQDQPEVAVHLTARGLMRWQSGRLADELLRGTDFDAFLQSLDDDEREPMEEMARLHAALKREPDHPGALLFRVLTLVPEERTVRAERWDEMREAMEEQENDLRDLLEERAAVLLPEELAPGAWAAVFLETVREWLR